jgi:hypothetical protein
MTHHCEHGAADRRQDARREEDMDYCEEHSGQKTLLKTMLGLVGTAVVLLLFMVGLTLNMKTDLSNSMAAGNKQLQDDLAKISTDLQRDLSSVRERIAVLEYRIAQSK